MSINANRDVERIVELMRTDDSVDAPAEAVRWAKNLFATRLAAEPTRSAVRRVLATLISDLLPNAPVFGQRSAGTSEARQLLFEAGDDAIDLRVKRDGKNAEVSGQIIGDGFAGASLRLAADEKTFETKVDETGFFSLSAVPCGEYSLVIEAPGVEIRAENIALT